MAVIQFDIQLPNGQRESTFIEGERALIGSASHCDVRLPMEQAAYEHVLVEVVGGTLRAEAKADDPPATLNRMPFSAAPLAEDSVLGIGKVRLFVTLVRDVDVGGSQLASKKSKQGSNPAVQIGLLAVFAAAAYLLLMEKDNQLAPPPQKTPELFTGAAPKCKHSNATQAVGFAAEQLALADGKRERMPFHASDGVAAVTHYQTAAACFRVAKEPEAAAEAEQAADSLKKSLQEDFRSRRLRLSHMIKVGDYEIARQDVKVLLALTEGKSGQYVDWLKRAAKDLEGKK